LHAELTGMKFKDEAPGRLGAADQHLGYGLAILPGSEASSTGASKPS
jgi:hypothetical protein